MESFKPKYWIFLDLGRIVLSNYTTHYKLKFLHVLELVVVIWKSINLNTTSKTLFVLVITMPSIPFTSWQKKMKFSIEDFFSKCDQIRSFQVLLNKLHSIDSNVYAQKLVLLQRAYLVNRILKSHLTEAAVQRCF